MVSWETMDFSGVVFSYNGFTCYTWLEFLAQVIRTDTDNTTNGSPTRDEED
jgi:hypothetical protein